MDEIDKVLERVEELYEQLTKEDDGVEVPTATGVETPTQEQLERHEATHTSYKRWCRHCNAGLAARDAHKDKKTQNINKHRKIKPRKFGEAGVPDTEAPKDGQTKSSMDYMTMDRKAGGSKVPATVVMVNHED